jgi:hypothetical protein
VVRPGRLVSPGRGQRAQLQEALGTRLFTHAGGPDQPDVGLDEVLLHLLDDAPVNLPIYAAIRAYQETCRIGAVAGIANMHGRADVLVAFALSDPVEAPLTLLVREAVPHDVAGMVEDYRRLLFRTEGSSDLLEVEGEGLGGTAEPDSFNSNVPSSLS